MKTIILVLLASLCVCTPAVADSFGSNANQFEISFVEIGAPGNVDDMLTRFPQPVGGVEYPFRIGQSEISREMVEKANVEGGLEITLDPMDEVADGPRPGMPATGVSWNEAARFVNWLNASEGFPDAYFFWNQPGEVGYSANANIDLWLDSDDGFDPANPFRNRLARYFLPSVDEWYKAAFYDPELADGHGGYWDFPTGSNTAPTPVASGSAANTAIYQQSLQQGPANIDQAGGLSAYGVMALGGNVWEWTESTYNLQNESSLHYRVVPGGGWGTDSLVLTGDYYVTPDIETSWMGFRVASTLEPPQAGDFNNDGILDADDIDQLTRQSAAMTHDVKFDLTGDSLVNVADIRYWVNDLAETWMGDANLDGDFNSTDLVAVFAAGQYQDGIAKNSIWSTGDWTGDGEFDSDDLVLAFQDDGYEQGPRPAVRAVPEPTSLLLLSAGVIVVAVRAVVDGS